LGVLGLGTLVLGIYTVGNLWAQPGGTRPTATTASSTPLTTVPASGKGRIALVNLQEIFKNYHKVKALDAEALQLKNQYEEAFKREGDALENKVKAMKAAPTQQEKDRLENEAKQIRYRLQDLRERGTKEIVKLQTERLAQIYREVEKVVAEYAKVNGIELVLRFGEDWDPKVYHTADAVIQRLNRPFWPMYFDSSMNITAQVLQGLPKG
jgi:Skp family chaperone for outer membrane proteins